MAMGKRLKTGKTGKKSILAIGKSRDSTGDVGNFVSKKNERSSRSRKTERGESNGNGVSYFDESTAAKKGGIRKRNVNSKIKGEAGEVVTKGNRESKAVNSDRKRKRIYAEQSTDKERVFRDNVRKHNTRLSSKSMLNKFGDDSHEEMRTRRGKIQAFEHSSRKDSLSGESKHEASRLLKEKNSRVKVRDKVELKDAEVNGVLKRSAKSKYGAGKKLEQDWTQSDAHTLQKSSKKKGQSKKTTADDSKIMDDRPKKKKRVIRIDPHDLSNKRLDDGISISNIVKEKEVSKSNSVELSKNAQFRAIRPSPSILSFVEENLLGRRREIEFRRAGYNTELSVPLDNIPFSTSTERERIEETAFRNKLSFFAAAKVSSSFPPPDLPEIAFAGRSNVGKSSLLNALTRQWGVVRTSDKPGLTQTINFFKLGSKLCLVDLPGYGFAYAKEEVKEAWEDLVKEYVSSRVGLKRVCVLVDTKWGMKPRDIELIDLMERYQTKYQIVLTKTDLVFPIDVARRAMQIEESLKEKKSAVQPVMMMSSRTGAGIRSLRTALSKIARFVKP